MQRNDKQTCVRLLRNVLQLTLRDAAVSLSEPVGDLIAAFGEPRQARRLRSALDTARAPDPLRGGVERVHAAAGRRRVGCRPEQRSRETRPQNPETSTQKTATQRQTRPVGATEGVVASSQPFGSSPPRTLNRSAERPLGPTTPTSSMEHHRNDTRSNVCGHRTSGPGRREETATGPAQARRQ